MLAVFVMHIVDYKIKSYIKTQKAWKFMKILSKK